MRHRAEGAVGEHAPRLRHEWVIALEQRHGGERFLRRRLVGNAPHLPRVDAHRLFHEEGIAFVEQEVRDAGHRAVTAERNDEIRPGFREHVPVIGERGRRTELRGALRNHRRIGILHADELHVRHFRQCLQVRGVEQRVPMADFDGGNTYGHSDE